MTLWRRIVLAKQTVLPQTRDRLFLFLLVTFTHVIQGINQQTESVADGRLDPIHVTQRRGQVVRVHSAQNRRTVLIGVQGQLCALFLLKPED